MRILLGLIAFACLISASSQESPQERQEPPGRGVLCIGTLIYFVEKTGLMCRPGEDPEFQARIAAYSDRFDDYIIRNATGGEEALALFKKDENLDSDDYSYICEGDVAKAYDGFLAIPKDTLDKAVNDLLENDGPPTFGDCV